MNTCVPMNGELESLTALILEVEGRWDLEIVEVLLISKVIQVYSSLDTKDSVS